MMDVKDILSTPSLDDMSTSIENDLKDNESKITNFRNGGIFKTITMIFLKAISELYGLILQVVPQVFLSSAKGIWLDLKAKEYNIIRKEAQKTEGFITAFRTDVDDAVIIPEGTIIKTGIDSSGNELRYISTEKIIMAIGIDKIKVPVIAELPGAAYNVPAGIIKFTFQHISGIDGFVNEDNWIVREGTDTEDDESLRDRCENFWDELATNPISATYASAILKVNGVSDVIVDDMHPRGQGSIDIIIIGAAGIPTESLLNDVREAVEKIRGPYDNVEVYGPEPYYQNLDITLYIDSLYGDEEIIKEEATVALSELFKMKKGEYRNKLYRAKITSLLMPIENVINVKINFPDDDVSLSKKQIIMPGAINITTIRET